MFQQKWCLTMVKLLLHPSANEGSRMMKYTRIYWNNWLLFDTLLQGCYRKCRAEESPGKILCAWERELSLYVFHTHAFFNGTTRRLCRAHLVLALCSIIPIWRPSWFSGSICWQLCNRLLSWRGGSEFVSDHRFLCTPPAYLLFKNQMLSVWLMALTNLLKVRWGGGVLMFL